MDLEVGERDTRLGRELDDQGEDYITKSETKWLRKGTIRLKDRGCMARETVTLQEGNRICHVSVLYDLRFIK